MPSVFEARRGVVTNWKSGKQMRRGAGERKEEEGEDGRKIL